MKSGSRQIKQASNTSVSPQESSHLECQECPFRKGVSAAESTTPLAERLSPAAAAARSSTGRAHAYALPHWQAQGTLSLCKVTQSTPPIRECQAVGSGRSEGPEYLISNSFSCVITSYKENGNGAEAVLSGSSYKKIIRPKAGSHAVRGTDDSIFNII